MRGSESGTSFRVSSSVDQITCFAPTSFAARAMFAAWAISFSGEKCSQKLVTAKTPCAPAKARRRLSTSSRSAATTSAPGRRAFSGLRVRARTAKPPLGSSRMARTRPPPWAPVAPATAMSLRMADLLGGAGPAPGLEEQRGERQVDRHEREHEGGDAPGRPEGEDRDAEDQLAQARGEHDRPVADGVVRDDERRQLPGE